MKLVIYFLLCLNLSLASSETWLPMQKEKLMIDHFFNMSKHCLSYENELVRYDCYDSLTEAAYDYIPESVKTEEVKLKLEHWSSIIVFQNNPEVKKIASSKYEFLKYWDIENYYYIAQTLTEYY
ncbi:hypothetical protein N9N67_10730 [Bacteriovoracaceae bacterium]|nr:hypothetical protein [Bacteriovoracaceae bacterium]